MHHLQVDGLPRTRIVLGDWYDQGSALYLSADGSHELRSLPRQAGSASIEASSSRV